MNTLKEFIYFIFGKPYSESKYYLFNYWFGVGFYFITISVLFIFAIFYGGWLPLLLIGLFFPIMIRFGNKMNINFNNSIKRLSKRTLIISIIAITLSTLGIFAAAFLFGDNLAINAIKTTNNGEVKLSIGSLKGSYDIETINIMETSQGTIVIPYEASNDEGDLFLIVKHSNEIIWNNVVSPSSEGVIEIEREKGDYEISVYTEESKNVKVNISLQ